MQTQVVVAATIAICSGVSINRCPSDVVSRQVLIKRVLTINNGKPPIFFKTIKTSGCKLDFTEKRINRNQNCFDEKMLSLCQKTKLNASEFPSNLKWKCLFNQENIWRKSSQPSVFKSP